MVDITYCKPAPSFVIIERIYSKTGMPSLGNTIGPQLLQVTRVVAQVCDEQNNYYEGKLITGTPSAWQVVSDYFSPGLLTQKATGKRVFMMVYAGFINSLQPINLPGVLPEVLTKTRDFTPPSPFIYGSDPIPNITLYKNPNVKFVASDGGQNPPTAVAIYNQDTGSLKIPPADFVDQAIADLLRGSPKKK